MSQLTTEKDKLEQLSKVPAKNEKDIEECETVRTNLEEESKQTEEAYHKAMSTLNSETQQLQDEKAKFETELIDLRKAVDEAKSVLDIAQAELDILLSTGRKEKKKLEQIISSLEKAEETVKTRLVDIKKLEEALPTQEQQFQKNNESLLKLMPELQRVEEELRTQRVKLEESRSAMHSSRSRGRVMDAIMEQKRNGNIDGIFGRLGDLGGIDEKYDVAISTACGPLDNIVVDTVETGQKCINFLKKNNIGTATFIALDKMEKWRNQCEKGMQTPENVPRLFDLIRMNDVRVKTAFYYALRDTLVANDLDQASRIAYGRMRHRVVTLKGELIEPAGTMSGGGRSVLRGRMGKQATIANVDPREVQQVESKVEELTSRATELRRERQQLEELVPKLGKDIKIIKGDLQKFKMELEGAQQQISTLKKQRAEQEEKVKSVKQDPVEVKRLEKDIAQKMKVYEEATASAQNVEAEVTRIHKQILEVTGNKMKKLKKSRDAVSTKLEKINAEITRLQVSVFVLFIYKMFSVRVVEQDFTHQNLKSIISYLVSFPYDAVS